MHNFHEKGSESFPDCDAMKFYYIFHKKLCVGQNVIKGKNTAFISFFLKFLVYHEVHIKHVSNHVIIHMTTALQHIAYIHF
jgi:hypothetical protein